MTFLLWHNPHCSKSREALALLRARGVEPAIVDYLTHPPHCAEIERVAQALGGPVKAMMRTHEPEFATLGLDEPGVSDAALYAAMAGYPQLIQRPILVHGDRAVVGRPPERVLDLLEPAR
jgi:arsenate reductase (glutaredoxin)